MIALPSLEGVPAALDHAISGIGAGKLARTALWLSQIVKDEESGVPGPWPPDTDPERIRTALVSWIEKRLSSLSAAVMKDSGAALSLKQREEAGAPKGLYLTIHHPFDVDVIFCDILPKIGEEDQRLEGVVIAALKTLSWFRNTYTYDDCFEQFQDWSEEQMNDDALGDDEIEGLQGELLWIEEHIPKDCRFIFRLKERPVFPPFPESPPASSWTHPWWRWAGAVRDQSLAWDRPMPDFPYEDLLPDNALLDPGLLTPLLWSSSDPLTEYFSEILDSEYEAGCEPLTVLPFNTPAQIREGVALMKRHAEWRDLFSMAARLPGPPRDTPEEENKEAAYR